MSQIRAVKLLTAASCVTFRLVLAPGLVLAATGSCFPCLRGSAQDEWSLSLKSLIWVLDVHGALADPAGTKQRWDGVLDPAQQLPAVQHNTRWMRALCKLLKLFCWLEANLPTSATFLQVLWLVWLFLEPWAQQLSWLKSGANSVLKTSISGMLVGIL